MSLPKPSGDFEWVQDSWGVSLRCRPLAMSAHHLFSTRDLRFEGTREDASAGWEQLATALGVETAALVRMRQVHCAHVFDEGGGSRFLSGLSGDWPEADIAVTIDPSVAVSVRSADCVPILLSDPRTGAVAAVHAGWKGTAEGAVMEAIRAMTSRYRTRPGDVIAAVGPSIGPCCYEVGPELGARFSAHPEAASWFTHDAKPHLDLWRATRDQLARAGVLVQQINVCELCTFHHPALFHSYRRDGASAGRLVAAIRSGPGTTL